MGSNREVRLRQRFWQDENDVNIKPLPRRRNQNESEQHVENPTASAEPRNFLDNLDTIVDPPASPHQHGSSVLRELLFDVEAGEMAKQIPLAEVFGACMDEVHCLYCLNIERGLSI